ncbi:hypothetical protein SASPL_111692 [Salvia splendens]|uniref:Uncharacterized protein n=1 Tax=Salvia splendens TaxID=180675 RepID=A0A8X8YB81_SALSN|nr:hypothetical protein SASPL_111692 [Salvia splendens]
MHEEKIGLIKPSMHEKEISFIKSSIKPSMHEKKIGLIKPSMQEKEISLIKSSIKPSMHEKKIGLIKPSADDLIKRVEGDGLINQALLLESRTREKTIHYMYVSLGSTLQASKQAVGEIAYGLLLSRVSFVWVVWEDADLPSGFTDEIEGRGLVVAWCNQIKVLSDPAVGGFFDALWVELCAGEHVRLGKEMKKVREKLHDALENDGSSEANFEQFVKDLEAKLAANAE